MYWAFHIYGFLIAPAVVIISLGWLCYALFRENDHHAPAYLNTLDAEKRPLKPRTAWKLPLLLFTAHLLLWGVFEEWERLVRGDQYVTSSGDFAIQLTPVSRILGYTFTLSLIVAAWRALRAKRTVFRFLSPLFLGLSLMGFYNTMEAIVCGTNGMRWYHWRFQAGNFFDGEYGLNRCIGMQLNREDMTGSWHPRITGIYLQGNTIVFERSGDAAYTVKKHMLIWWYDTEEIMHRVVTEK